VRRLVGRTANDGLEALDVGAAFLPDVVLLDIGMPRLNGLEACAEFVTSPGARMSFL